MTKTLAAGVQATYIVDVYREPGRKLPVPISPTVPVDLLRMPWSTKALIASIVYGPLFALWLWFVEEGSGPRQLPLAYKMALAVAFALWIGMLFVLRAQHQAKMHAALASMEEQEAIATRLATSPALSHGEAEGLPAPVARASSERVGPQVRVAEIETIAPAAVNDALIREEDASQMKR